MNWDSLPPPSQVPGYAEAVARGWVRPVPTTPPPRMEGRGSHDLMIRYALTLLVTTPLLVSLFYLDHALLLALGLFAWFVHVISFFPRFGNVLLTELARGYTTTTFVTGTFWWTTNRWVGWDFRGVWRYEGGKELPPEPGAPEPPGLYPSPTTPGKWMVWTGHAWHGGHRPPPDGVN